MSTGQPADPQVMPFARQHLAGVLAIERQSYTDPWSEWQFGTALANREVSMLVACAPQSMTPLGYIVMRRVARELEIWNLAVDPACRRRGIGRLLVARARAKLAAECCDSLVAHVRETDLQAQLFYRAMHFRAVRTDRPGVVDPAIRFEYARANEILASVIEGDGRVVR